MKSSAAIRLLISCLCFVALSADAVRADELTPEQFNELQKQSLQLGLEAQRHFFAGRFSEAVQSQEKMVEIMRRLYPASKHPDGNLFLTNSVRALGAMYRGCGEHHKALPLYEEALAMTQRLHPVSRFPDGHPTIALMKGNLANLLQEMGAHEKALGLSEDAVAMARAMYRKTGSTIEGATFAGCLDNLGAIRRSMGAIDKALPAAEEALAIRRKVYENSANPNGHPQIALSYNNIGYILLDSQSFAPALASFRQSLAMYEKLYPAERFPDGHPDLAASLMNVASAMDDADDSEAAQPVHARALEMYRKLHPASKFPSGHPDLAICMQNVGINLRMLGKYEQSLDWLRQSLAMFQRLYPKATYRNGHPHLHSANFSLAFFHVERGQWEEALGYAREQLAMTEGRIQRETAFAAEADALALVRNQAVNLALFLSVARHVPNLDSEAYAAVWRGKSAATRVMEQRQAGVRAAGAGLAREFDQIRLLRRNIESTLHNVQLSMAERDRIVTRLSDERDALENRLAAQLPADSRRPTEPADAKQLARLLPPRSAFVDFIAYNDQPPAPKDRKIPSRVLAVPSYAAFVIRTDGSITRIDLGKSAAINAAIAKWRFEIENRQSGEGAQTLSQLLWRKVAEALPDNLDKLFISPDGELSRIPWGALPVADSNEILLEKLPGGLAVVPHGPFLLESLSVKAEANRPERGMVLAAVKYGSANWPELPGTELESKLIAQSALQPPARLEKDQATVKQVIDALPRVGWAHLATHGYFAKDELAAEKSRDQKRWLDWSFNATRISSRVAAVSNPLGYVGLVLAGGDVLTGLSIIDLPLSKLNLVTLSACETGLGESSSGEGVFGLARAFHLAGCRNVVASLWKVSDAATAALMAKFYHELWVNKKAPLAALREAQLTIYHNPELIPDLAGERGAPKAKEALAVKNRLKSQLGAKADTKLWAAFVLSGSGH